MSDEPIEIILHPALIEPFKHWLSQRGLLLARFPDDMQESGRLEGYFVTPTDEAMRRAQHE